LGSEHVHWFGKRKYIPGAAADLGLRENVQRAQVHSPSELWEIDGRVEAWMRLLGYSRQDLFAVQLALHEAVINAFQHGNRGDRGKSIRVAFLITADEVLVRVEDDGKGFDPNLLPDPLGEKSLNGPGGRGLLLMRAYTTWLNVEPPGNRVTFCRRRSDAPKPPRRQAAGPGPSLN
jgi:serine/threonine-protein kinase RsbW